MHSYMPNFNMIGEGVRCGRSPRIQNSWCADIVLALQVHGVSYTIFGRPSQVTVRPMLF